MMANDGNIDQDTLFGPERLRARAIDWDQIDRMGSARSRLKLSPGQFAASRIGAHFIRARSHHAAIQTHSGRRSDQWHLPLITWPQPKSCQHQPKSPCPAGAIHTWSERQWRGVVASASQGDGEAGWSGHRARKAIHGYKAHVAADADTGLVECVDVTPGNVHDGRAGGAVVPDAPGLVHADSAYRGARFAEAVRARGGVTRVAPTSWWGRPGDEEAAAAFAAEVRAIHRIRSRIEKIFGTWKRSYGLRRMRWRGLARAALQVRLTAIAYNLRRSVSLLRTA